MQGHFRALELNSFLLEHLMLRFMNGVKLTKSHSFDHHCVQVASSLGSDGKNWDDYILVSQDGELQPADGAGTAGNTPPISRGQGLVRMDPEGAAGNFHDPLMAGIASGSSSPDEGSTHSKDSDFTIVNPNDL